MIDLIIVNLYGTIVPSDGKPMLRQGFRSFLERYKNKLHSIRRVLGWYYDIKIK